MFKRHAIVFSVLLMLILPFALSGISQATMLFLTFEPGARANAMGRAYSAIADDAYAMWWNPGATAFNKQTQIAATHSPWLQGSGIDDIFYEYLGFNNYFYGIGNINAHVIWLDAGTQPQTSSQNEDLGDFHTYEVAGAIGYGYEIVPEKIGIGGNFKLLYSYLGPGTGLTETEGSAFSFAFDAGALFKDVAVDNLNASIVIQNIGPDITYVDKDQSDPAPMTFRAGLGYTVFDNPMGCLITTAEMSKILADETIYGVGAEYTYLNLIALRGGYYSDNAGEVEGASFGVGVHYKFSNRYKLGFDFAMVPAGGLTKYNKIFSLGFEF
jgi:hypothetical protein